jgi:hypothetical protein
LASASGCNHSLHKHDFRGSRPFGSERDYIHEKLVAAPYRGSIPQTAWHAVNADKLAGYARLTNSISGKSTPDDPVILSRCSWIAQYVTIWTAGSYLSSSNKRAHFGLGADAVAKSIENRRPTGAVQTLENVRADRCSPSMSRPQRPPKR